MKLLVAAVGHRMPAWVDAAVADYVRRMPRDMPLGVAAVKTPARTAAVPVQRQLAEEARRLYTAVPAGHARIVLDERGTLMSTAELARRLERWRLDGRDRAFLVGGADGLAASVRREAEFVWSLSPLTLPHGLARVVVVEQLYRAVSLLQGHPYHRE